MVGRTIATAIAVAMMVVSLPIMQGRASNSRPACLLLGCNPLSPLLGASNSQAQTSMKLRLRGGSEPLDDGPIMDMPQGDEYETINVDEYDVQSVSAGSEPTVIDVEKAAMQENEGPAAHGAFVDDDDEKTENTKELLDFFVKNGRIWTKDAKGEKDEDAIEDEFYLSDAEDKWNSRNQENITNLEMTQHHEPLRNESHLKLLNIHLDSVETNNLAKQRKEFLKSFANSSELVTPFKNQPDAPLQVGDWVSFKTEQGGVRYGFISTINETDFVYVFRKNDWDLGTDRVNISLVEKVDLAYWADDDEMEKEKKKEVDDDRFQELTFEPPKFDGLEDEYNIENVIQRSLGTFDDYEYDDPVDGNWNQEDDPHRVFPQRLW